MIIRPVEMQGMVQQSQNVSQVKQNEDGRGFVEQSNILVHEQKTSQIKHESVVKHENADRKKENYDAKEKGNGQYFGGSNNKKNKNQEDGKVILKGNKSFDIKI